MRDASLIDIDEKPDLALEAPGVVIWEPGQRPRLVPADAARFDTALARVGAGPVRCLFIRPKKRRSLPQNRFLWGPFYGALLDGFRELYVGSTEQCPFKTKDQLHSAMKYMILGPSVLTLPRDKEGREVTLDVEPTTTTLTPAQFNAYWRSIARWSALKYAIYLPEPNERWEPMQYQPRKLAA